MGAASSAPFGWQLADLTDADLIEIGDLIHQAKHRAATEYFGWEPGCDALGCP